MQRTRLVEVLQTEPYPMGRMERMEEISVQDTEMLALKKRAREMITKIVEGNANLPNDLVLAAEHAEDPQPLGRYAGLQPFAGP